MLQKMELQQLMSHSLEEIQAYQKKFEDQKSELEALKGSKKWGPAMQEALDDTVLHLVDIAEVLEEKLANMGKEATTKTASYIPAPGTEEMVHLSLVQGRRFNPFTGKEESKAFVQIFTFAEWQLFKKHYRNLGYTAVSVLHDPYGDAADVITK